MDWVALVTVAVGLDEIELRVLAAVTVTVIVAPMSSWVKVYVEFVAVSIGVPLRNHW